MAPYCCHSSLLVSLFVVLFFLKGSARSQALWSFWVLKVIFFIYMYICKSQKKKKNPKEKTKNETKQWYVNLINLFTMRFSMRSQWRSLRVNVVWSFFLLQIGKRETCTSLVVFRLSDKCKDPSLLTLIPPLQLCLLVILLPILVPSHPP